MWVDLWRPYIKFHWCWTESNIATDLKRGMLATSQEDENWLCHQVMSELGVLDWVEGYTTMMEVTPVVEYTKQDRRRCMLKLLRGPKILALLNPSSDEILAHSIMNHALWLDNLEMFKYIYPRLVSQLDMVTMVRTLTHRHGINSKILKNINLYIPQ